jgi:hypothetical protein
MTEKTEKQKQAGPTRATAILFAVFAVRLHAAPRVFAAAGIPDVDAVEAITNLTDFIMLVLRFGGVVSIAFGFVQFMVHMKHYLLAIRYEFVKTGKVFTRSDFEPYANQIL